MKVTTAWVQPPQSIGGLDHLGSQAPCVLIYAQLLPGITNVTDRARYYSFYPWLLWSFDQRYPKDPLAFVEFFRRADCLFTLIAERHARQTDGVAERHSVAMAGRVKLLPALDRLEAGEPLRLSEYADKDSSMRYFKNSLGGLGQYYAGTLSDLLLLNASSKPWINYTTEHGEPLAKCLDLAGAGQKFWDVVEQDEISLADLDSLDRYCPCQLVENEEERRSLTDLYFDRSGIYDAEGMQRRRSLGLILHLVHALSEGEDRIDLDESVFRACVYSGALPGGARWHVPESLLPTLKCWGIYERNDLLSVAFQAVLALLLRALQPQEWSERQTYSSVEEFAARFSAGESVARAIESLGVDTFGTLLADLASTAPPMGAWEREDHEIVLLQALVGEWHRGGDTATILASVIRVLALLVFRDDESQAPYGSLAISHDDLAAYPINLVSFRARARQWKNMSLQALVNDLALWCMNTHLRVALRKLRQTGRSTFHLRPSEQGLEVVGQIPPPARTTPRFKQGVQILRDIGALERNVEGGHRQTVLSASGLELLGVARA